MSTKLMEIPLEITEALKNNNLVIFAGSGLSSNFNFPSWKKLVEEIVNDLNNENYNPIIPLLNKGILDPLAALDMLKHEEKRVRNYIKTNFKVSTSADLTLHKKILETSGSIITTNYDNAFELASSNSIIPTKFTSTYNISEINKDNNPYIFKLHGCYTEPDNCIVFKSDYNKLYSQTNASIEKLKSIFIDKTILFLGFSFSDKEINLIFESLNKHFNGYNKHFILTSDISCKFEFLKPIVIHDYKKDIPTFFDQCIAYKKSSILASQIVYSQDNIVTKEIPKIAFLKPNPVDNSFDTELMGIENCLDDVEINLYKGYLNTDTLESIDDYDILIIATKVFKNKLYLEDSNLRSILMSTSEICSHIPNDGIPIIFITNQKIDLIPNYNTINISTYKRSTIKRFVFKALRNNDLVFSPNEEIAVGLSAFTNLEFKKGNSKVSSIYSNNRVLDIGEKSLKSIVGRVEEQAAIIGKIQNIIKYNRILTIKASGGTGKTTLIKKVAYELYNRGFFKEGVSFKTCENIESYDEFEELLYDAFNLLNILNFKDYLIENYSSKKLDSLIILDNFETISNNLEDKEIEKVHSLLKFSSDFSNIVITSRERLPGLEDFEDLYSLSPLTTDDALTLFEICYGKVDDKDEMRVLRQDILEDMLNNNPLAIKLVTKSRTRFRHINELHNQLKEHFFESLDENFSSVYESDEDLNIERTKSIYQSINYSYTTLKTKEKIAFELLSLFPDGISLNNFKKCFEKSNSSNRISDLELRILRDKSLVEDYNGTLQLQPIIRKFAEFKFQQREVEIKQKYCLDAYRFNCHIHDLIEFIERKKTYSEALKIFNLYRNNLLNVFSYIPDIELDEKGPVPEKKYLLNYIYRISYYVVNEKQLKEFYKKINSTLSYFKDLPHAETLINVIKLYKQYFHEDFEIPYNKLSKLFSPEEMEKRENQNEEYIESRYKNLICSIHDMEGYTISRLKSHIKNSDFSKYLDASLFYLGIPNEISTKKDGFYFFEYELMYNRLNVEKLEAYIESLYQEEHLEIMQATYTLSKICSVNKKAIKKLVVTNPYTEGLKNLMYAFVTESEIDKKALFVKALRNLAHIKYYYLEALYFYSRFLKEENDPAYYSIVNEGIELSSKYRYQYLNHIFNNLFNDTDAEYQFNFSYYNIPELEEYVRKHNNEWEKEFKERDAFYER